MKLPIAIEADGKLFTNADIGGASAGVLAEARREATAGASYTAILEWSAGVVRAFTGPDGDVTEKADIRRLIRQAPFETVHAIACYGMAATKGDDSIEGEYACPKCGTIVKATKRVVDGTEEDFSDHLGALEYGVLENPADGISIVLDEPVEITRKDTGEVIETIETIIMNWPTLGTAIRCHQRAPDDDSALQFAIYAESTRSVNGKTVDQNWRATRGDMVYRKMSVRDQAKITAAMKRYSIEVKKERVCIKCKNRWEAEIDLRNFFESGLMSD